MISLLLKFDNIFQKLSSLSIVDFEKINAGSDISLGIFWNFQNDPFFHNNLRRLFLAK